MAGSNVTVDTQRIGSLFRQLAAAAGIGLAATNHVAVSGAGQSWVRGIMGLGGVILFIVEHYVSDPSTGTPTSSGSSDSPAPPSQPLI